MQPSDVYSMILSQLTAARSLMLSAEWQTELDEEPQAVRISAGNIAIQVQGAILSLSNASLSDIATAMQANETQLQQATTDLGKALDDLTKVDNIITAASNVLTVVAKILPLL